MESQMTMDQLHERFFPKGIVHPQIAAGELLLDVRTPEEFEDAHIEGSKNIDHEEVFEHLDELRQYEKIFCYCRTGRRSTIVADVLSKFGFQNVILLGDDGMLHWQEQGYPVVRGAN